MLVLEMLNHMVKRTQRKIFYREDTATERRVLAAFLYHAGLSYRKIESFVEKSHVAVHDWYHRLSHLFEVERDSRKRS
jgi:putative transposase